MKRAIAPEAIPAGSGFKGYEEYVIQDLIIRAHNTRYRLERWQTPAGETLLNKSELLLVLERPELPLHTNDSERDIRDYVQKRKVSGGTRSDRGRRCRDTLASLKKTCPKLGISFW